MIINIFLFSVKINNGDNHTVVIEIEKEISTMKVKGTVDGKEEILFNGSFNGRLDLYHIIYVLKEL